MKKLSTYMIIAAVSWTTMLQSGCYGSFELVKKVYDWNGTLGGKFTQSLMFWVLSIIPVYGVAGMLDVVIFNLVEFWSGSNPLAMKEGEKEQQTVIKDGITYRMEATRNQMLITQLDGSNAGMQEKMIYNPADKSWNLEKNGEVRTIARLEAGSDGQPVARLFGNDNSITFSAPADEASLAAAMKSLRAAEVAVR